MGAGRQVKEHGAENDLLERLKADPLFEKIKDRIDGLTDPMAFVGRAPQQAKEMLDELAYPLLSRLESEVGDFQSEEISV